MKPIKCLKLRPVAGMFSNVNEVIQQLYLAEQSGYQFVIDWGESCYRYDYLEQDPWEYYFQPCFDFPEQDSAQLEVLAGGVCVACTRDNIITPRLQDGNCSPLLLPKDRQLSHDLIKRYLVVSEVVQGIIDAFMTEHFAGQPVIGLHIRGPGRVDGGAPGLRNRYPCKNGVPFDLYFSHVDAQLQQKPSSKLFICSDSSFVMMEVSKRYGDRVITYNSTRSPFGEMHISGHPQNSGQSFSGYKLGEDVLVEAYLLAKTNYLVHGNSNVVNFVLCENPTLEHDYVYAE